MCQYADVILLPHRWGLAGSILALETLKLALAPINRARDILVGQALQAGLVAMLLGKLDWRKAGAGSNHREDEVLILSLWRLYTFSLLSTISGMHWREPGT